MARARAQIRPLPSSVSSEGEYCKGVGPVAAYFSVEHPLIALTSDLARASSRRAWPFGLGRRGKSGWKAISYLDVYMTMFTSTYERSCHHAPADPRRNWKGSRDLRNPATRSLGDPADGAGVCVMGARDRAAAGMPLLVKDYTAHGSRPRWRPTHLRCANHIC